MYRILSSPDYLVLGAGRVFDLCPCRMVAFSRRIAQRVLTRVEALRASRPVSPLNNRCTGSQAEPMALSASQTRSVTVPQSRSIPLPRRHKVAPLTASDIARTVEKCPFRDTSPLPSTCGKSIIHRRKQHIESKPRPQNWGRPLSTAPGPAHRPQVEGFCMSILRDRSASSTPDFPRGSPGRDAVSAGRSLVSRGLANVAEMVLVGAVSARGPPGFPLSPNTSIPNP